jgi:hypothetical protein
MSLIPREVLEQLDHAARSMDDMNGKLDAILDVLVEIRDILKETT